MELDLPHSCHVSERLYRTSQSTATPLTYLSVSFAGTEEIMEDTIDIPEPFSRVGIEKKITSIPSYSIDLIIQRHYPVLSRTFSPLRRELSCWPPVDLLAVVEVDPHLASKVAGGALQLSIY